MKKKNDKSETPPLITDNDPLGINADGEAAEARNIEAAAEGFQFTDVYYAGGDCRDAMLTVIKQAVDWQKMKEGHQRDIIAAVSTAAGEIVTKIARECFTEGRPEYSAKLEKVEIKDGIKLAFKGLFDVSVIKSLAALQGHNMIILLAAPDNVDHARAPAAYDPDQPNLIPEGDDDLANAGDADPTRRVHRVESTGELKVAHAETGADLGEVTVAERAAFEFDEDDAKGGNLAPGARVNLGNGMVEVPDGDGWKDLRDATPDEMATARNAQADFDA